MRLNRRRFLSLSAALPLAAGVPAFAAPKVTRWRGVALGAPASITLAHPEADRIIAAARTEIDRLEQVFSLYRSDSALMRLNAAGRLDAPPLELVDCLGLAGAVHAGTGGRFDPSVQPLWALHAEAWSAGAAPAPEAVAVVLERTGWENVSFAPDRIAFARPGMALTLNGIAQGYIADRVVELLAAEGLTGILVETGEIRALGGAPDGGGWPVTLAGGGRRLALENRALASSAPLGTTFDQKGQAGHILDPQSGLPVRAEIASVSVSAPTAALADALSTALCLTPRSEIDATVARFGTARLEEVVPA